MRALVPGLFNPLPVRNELVTMALCQTLSVAFDESLRFSFLAISPYPRLAEEPAPGSVNALYAKFGALPVSVFRPRNATFIGVVVAEQKHINQQ